MMDKIPRADPTQSHARSSEASPRPLSIRAFFRPLFLRAGYEVGLAWGKGFLADGNRSQSRN